MKKLLFLLACLLCLARGVQAQTPGAFTLRIDAGRLENSTGTAQVPVGGLLELIASPSGTFSAPTSSAYVTGDNVLVSSFAMNNNSGTAETLNTMSSFPLTGSGYTLTTGEALELRFYPSLTAAAPPNTPTLGTTYGEVRSSTIEFGPSGGDLSETAWVVPSAGSTVDFDYVTVSNGGSYANATAFATNVVLVGSVPEPSFWGIAGGILMSCMCVRVWKSRLAVGPGAN